MQMWLMDIIDNFWHNSETNNQNQTENAIKLSWILWDCEKCCMSSYQSRFFDHIYSYKFYGGIVDTFVPGTLMINQ